MKKSHQLKMARRRKEKSVLQAIVRGAPAEVAVMIRPHSLRVISDKELDDMLAFAEQARARGESPEYVGNNLFHDVFGLVRSERCFLPRSAGCAAKVPA